MKKANFSMQTVSKIVASFALIACAGSALAQTPQMGGPMKHLMVHLHGTMLHVHIDESVPTPIMLNYGESYAGNASVLDGKMYNAQYGWMVEGFWAPPAGSFLWIEQISATPGLEVYGGGAFGFAPIFGTDGSSPRIQWNGMMLHNWYAATTPGVYEATYNVYFGDASGMPTPGFQPDQVTLSLIAVPAPGAAGLLAMGALVAARRRRAAN